MPNFDKIYIFIITHIDSIPHIIQNGKYSSFGLELLSTIDFILSEKEINSEEDIINELKNWSNRKKTLFTNPKFIQIALNNLNLHLN